MEISEEVCRVYKAAQSVREKPMTLYSAVILADALRALRDMTARAMRAEFYQEHIEKPTHIGCPKCILGEYDECHNWTWEQWQAAADKALRGEK